MRKDGVYLVCILTPSPYSTRQADQHQDDSGGDGEAATESAQDDDESTGDTSGQSGSDPSENGGQHPFTAFGGRSRSGAQSGLDALAEIDEGIADQVAKRLTEHVREVVEEPDPDE